MNFKNPLLMQVADAQMKRIPPQLQDTMTRAVMAGKKIMYAPQTRKLLTKQLSQGGDMAEVVGEGVAKLVLIIWRDSKGKIPLRVLIPAGVVLVCEGLEFLVDSGVIDNVTNVEVDTATKEFSSSFLQMIGVSPEKLQGMIQNSSAKLSAKGLPGQASAQPQPGGIIAAQQGE